MLRSYGWFPAHFQTQLVSSLCMEYHRSVFRLWAKLNLPYLSCSKLVGECGHWHYLVTSQWAQAKYAGGYRAWHIWVGGDKCITNEAWCGHSNPATKIATGVLINGGKIGLL